MNKSSFFTGQPIFNQILNFIPRNRIDAIGRENKADHYCKSFRTYEHLVTMLFAVFNQCNSLREVTTGLLAWERRINHLGIDGHPRRSTISDANKRRSHEVFEKIYLWLAEKYKAVLPDSRPGKDDKVFLFDSTSIALFREILKASGLSSADGKRKGGIKVHTLLNASNGVPHKVFYSAGADSDSKFLKNVELPAGSILIFDKGYRNYNSYNRLTDQQIIWVTRNRDQSVYSVIRELAVSKDQQIQGITSDAVVQLGHSHSPKAIKVTVRMVKYKDPVTAKEFVFISNGMELTALSIANYYKQRWQIEVFFKSIKQNFPLQYFLGDNENAIKIQIWSVLIAHILLKIVKRGTCSRMSYSNIVGLVRLHLMTYINLNSFLKEPEKSLLRKIKRYTSAKPSLFPT